MALERAQMPGVCQIPAAKWEGLKRFCWVSEMPVLRRWVETWVWVRGLPVLEEVEAEFWAGRERQRGGFGRGMVGKMEGGVRKCVAVMMEGGVRRVRVEEGGAVGGVEGWGEVFTEVGDGWWERKEGRGRVVAEEVELTLEEEREMAVASYTERFCGEMEELEE